MDSNRSRSIMATGQTDKNSRSNAVNTLSTVECNAPKRVPYPKHVAFIIGNEFCERFSFLGLKSLLVVYLEDKLCYSAKNAIVLYHGFVMTLYFMCIFGGIISDVWLGKFKTILSLSIIYLLGNTVVAISSIPSLTISPSTILIFGLVLISIGSGGIKPCVSPFGGDQFKLPEQAAQLTTFFKIFYLSINVASIISTVITPMLNDVHCFGEKDCYPLAFGIPVILMLLANVLFVIGKPLYSFETVSSKNMLIEVAKCITNAIKIRTEEGHKYPGKRLLDFSIEKYGEQLVNDTRVLLRILVLYIPLPIFWTLMDQTGSRWTLQAKKLNGDIGFYQIKPEQVQMLSPLLVFIFIPFFGVAIYPLLNKIGIRRPLQKMTIGGFFVSIAFLFSAYLQSEIESSSDKSVHMVWILPQYIILSMGQAMFDVTGITFSYEQAPKSMKSVIMAIWCLAITFGSLITIIITELSIFSSQTYDFLLFSGIMFIDILVFIVLAYNYKSNNTNEEKQEEKVEG